LDKNNLNKICVKDLNLTIELIEREISFLKQREPTGLKPIKMSIQKLSGITKMMTSKKAKSPRIK
jgi:hypothetical protein